MQEEKQISMNELASMVATGFSSMDERFESLRTELKGGVSNLHSEINSRFDEISTEIADLRAEVKRVSERSKEDSDVYGADIVKINKRLDHLEKQFQTLKSA
jgi:uncharacterized coiled-coil DUF342 family protein